MPSVKAQSLEAPGRVLFGVALMQQVRQGLLAGQVVMGVDECGLASAWHAFAWPAVAVGNERDLELETVRTADDIAKRASSVVRDIPGVQQVRVAQGDGRFFVYVVVEGHSFQRDDLAIDRLLDMRDEEGLDLDVGIVQADSVDLVPVDAAASA